MAKTTFSGPVGSPGGFTYTPVLTAALPTPTPALRGLTMMVSDNGAGDNEFCIVICTGAAWVTAVGAALT